MSVFSTFDQGVFKTFDQADGQGRATRVYLPLLISSRKWGLLAVWETGVRLPASKGLWTRVRLRVHGPGSPGTVNRPLRSCTPAVVAVGVAHDTSAERRVDCGRPGFCRAR